MDCNKHAHPLTSKSNHKCDHQTSSASLKLSEIPARDTVTSLKKLGVYSFEIESDTHLVYL